MEIPDYQHLKEMGVKFQLNFLSLMGRYGRNVQKKAEQLLKYTMDDMAGSDLHASVQCELLQKVQSHALIVSAIRQQV